MMINCDDSLHARRQQRWERAEQACLLRERAQCQDGVRHASLACFNALKANVAATAAMLR